VSEERLTWKDVTREAGKLGSVEEAGDTWLGLLVRMRDERLVRIRLEVLLVGRELHLGAVAGGRPAGQVALSAALAWNASLPPGATIILHDSALWLRFLVPLSRLSSDRTTRLITFVARESARLVVEERGVADRDACAIVFHGFAE
jgi:hypothetical protein